jgi:flagellar biosynthesis component FlhA
MGTLSADTRFADASPDVLRAAGIDFQEATNPETATAGGFVTEDQEALARSAGIGLWGLLEYPMRHLRAVIENQLTSFLGHQEVLNLLEEQESEIRRTILARPELLSPLTAVLRALVDEGVPIVALDALCARFMELHEASRPLSDIAEALRVLPDVLPVLPGNRDARPLFQAGDAFEQRLVAALHEDGGPAVLAMAPQDCQEVLAAVRNAVAGEPDCALVLRSAALRPLARLLFEIEFPRMAILAERELEADWATRLRGRIELEAAVP